MIQLDIISDPICPWCYIGKTNLDRALAEVGDNPFTLRWHPYQLNPDMPEGGMDRRDYLETKFGGRDGAVRAYAPVMEHAERAGLAINFEGITRTPNTLDAHRLIFWAGQDGQSALQTAMVDALFAAYFVEGRDIGDHEVLADIADSVGLDAAAISRALATDADREALAKEDASFREMGITGVPTFIVNRQHAVPGAQPPETWVAVLTEITEKLKAAPAD